MAGHNVYVTSYAGLEIFDISNPTNCVPVGTYTSPFEAGPVTVEGSYAYVGDSGAYAGDSGGLSIIDVSDPTNCVRLGRCAAKNPQGVKVAGHHAFVADGYGGLLVIDVQDPFNPVRVGGYAAATSLSIGIAIASHYAFVGDLWNGLEVIDVANPTNCVLVGSYKTLDMPEAVVAAGNRLYLADMGGGLVGLRRMLNVDLALSQATTQTTLLVDGGIVGTPCTIEATTNLNQPMQWTSILTTNPPAFPFEFTEADSGLFKKPQKFYRARQP